MFDGPLLGIPIPGSRIPGSRPIFSIPNPGIGGALIPGFRDYKNLYIFCSVIYNKIVTAMFESLQCPDELQVLGPILLLMLLADLLTSLCHPVTQLAAS